MSECIVVVRHTRHERPEDIHVQGVLLGDPHTTALVPVGKCQPSHLQGRAPGPVSLPESYPGPVEVQGCFLA